MSWEVRQGDALSALREMDAGTVQTVVTSPPYWGLRDYGSEGQLGLEPTPEEYVANLVEVFGEVRRVLRDDGTVWLNLGDSYASSTGEKTSHPQQSRNGRQGVVGLREKHPSASRANLTAFKDFGTLKPKDLCGIPWRVAFALQADGWYLRSDIIWAKPNPMPESVRDRPTRSHEYVFLLTKSARYFFDADAVREEHAESTEARAGIPCGGKPTPNGNNHRFRDKAIVANGRNKRTVWTVATQAFPGAHFATFPYALVEPCVLAGSSPKARGVRNDSRNTDQSLVLDPFCGSGTVGVVALRLDRAFLGLELNPIYCKLARQRILNDAPLLNMNLAVAL